MRPSRDPDGFVPIENYAVIGDGRTIALISLDGRVDWWPLPTLDSPPVFGALLDPARGGFFQLAPKAEFDVIREYVNGTNVLKTTFSAEAGTATITAAMNSGSAGRLPWTELAFRVEGIAGNVEFEFLFCPGARFDEASPWITARNGIPIATIEDQTIAFLAGNQPFRITTHSVSGVFRISDEERHVLALVATDDEPLFLPPLERIDKRIDGSIASWQQWTSLLDNEGEWSSQVERSSLALKTLLDEETGAIAAAATTSLPEQVGGPKNWDYRYAWIRDSSFVLDALINLGLHEEVHGAMSWLLDALRKNGGDLAVFYSLGGEMPNGCTELNVPGYRGSRPVRAGNDAAHQTQLGTYGDLFDTVHRYVCEGHFLDAGTAHTLENLADACCDAWRHKDSGIWELSNERHYTISKIGCWLALDRAVHLAEEGQIATRHAERWRMEAAEIRDFVETRCWSDSRRSYTFYADTDELDAAVLFAGRTGFERGARLSSTVDAVIAELAAGPCVYRYSGADKEEGAFIACSFWAVEALVYCHRLSEASALMNKALSMANDVGILSEQFEPNSGSALGNTPQALSHLALINAVHTFRRAKASDEHGS